MAAILMTLRRNVEENFGYGCYEEHVNRGSAITLSGPYESNIQ